MRIRRFPFALIFFCLLFLSLNVRSADSLSVAAGETYTLPVGTELLDLDRLELEDHALLILPGAAEHVFIRASDVVIGKNVTIRSTPGIANHGADGASYSIEAKDCASPVSGERGNDGHAGDDAPDLTLSWRLRSFGSLRIELAGGNGGQGGNGGDGQDADQSKGCRLADGGAAGDGGKGGKAGDGGSVVFSYGSVGNVELALDARKKTKIINGAGAFGEGGKPGRPGKGSSGRYINKKSLGGNRTWVAGGNRGSSGSKGGRGEPGDSGLISFQLSDVAPVADAPKRIKKQLNAGGSEASASLELRVKALEEELEALKLRLEVLEGTR